MPDFVTNGEISRPIFHANLKADVDLGGLKFSYEHGMFYAPSIADVAVKLPAPHKEPGT